MTSDMQRDVGRLEARTEAIEDRLDRIEKKVDRLAEVVANARGGWKMLAAVAAATASLGAALSSFVQWIRHP